MLTAPLNVLAMVLADSVGVKRFGSLNGIMGFFWTGGISCGPLAAGWIFDRTGSYSLAFELCAASCVVASLAVLACAPLKHGEPTTMGCAALA
jgi:MFS family permease